MKKIKIMVLALIGMMTKSMAIKANENMVFAENLPTDAKAFVMHNFPRLEGKEIFFTTFSFLRQLFLNQLQNVEFEHIFYNPLKEKLDNYNDRIKSEIGINV